MAPRDLLRAATATATAPFYPTTQTRYCVPVTRLIPSLLLGCVLAGSACATGGPQSRHATSSPPTNTLWAGVRAGVTVPVSATLAGQSAAELLRLDPDPYPLYGAQMMFRTSRFDIGAQFDNLYGGTFRGLEKTQHLGARSRLLAAVRWRGFEASWGAIFSGLGVGVMFFNHHDDVLNLTEAIAELPPGGGVRPSTDRYNSGFTFNLAAGIMVYPTRYLIVFLEAEMAGGSTSITADPNAADIEYGILRIQANLGVELRIF